MIKQDFLYECDSTNLTEALKLIQNVNKELESGRVFDKRFFQR